MQIRMAAEKGAAATYHRWTKKDIHGQSAKKYQICIKKLQRVSFKISFPF